MFKVFIEFVTVYASVFYFLIFFLAARHMGILALQGSEPTASALKGKVLTTGPPGKSCKAFFKAR